MATNLGTAYVRIEPSAKGIGNEISNILNNEASGAGEKAGSKLASGLGGALKVGGAVIGAGIAAATTAVVGFGKEAVASYANYEQLIGGVEKLYGDAAGKLEQFANDAYKTSGMSANQYMETATQFSAALISSLDEDVETAANMTDVAMQAMSDNVNVFGSNMEDVTNAFKGFSKGSFVMLDNLKLGYGGTSAEMERLLRDAEEYEGFIEGSLSIDNFNDIITAIDIVQEHMGIAGATSAEAMGTIEGSANMTKAAWANLITTIGRGEGMQEAFDGLLTSIFGDENGGGLLNNILPRIETVMQGIGEFVAKASPIIADKLPALIEGIVPSLLTAGVSLIEGLGQGLLSALPTLMPIAVDVLLQIVRTLLDNIGLIISVGIQLISELVIGIAQATPELIPATLEAIYTITDSLLDNIDLLIDAAVQLAIGIAVGLVQAIPVIVEKAPLIISKLAIALVGAIPKLVLAAGQLMTAFLNAILNMGAKLASAGQNIVDGLKNGIVNAWGNLVNKVKEMASNLVNSVKNVFKISSPSKVFAQIGDYCVQGFDNSFDSFGDNALTSVEDAMSDMSSVSMPTLEADMRVNGNYKRADNSSDVYNLLAQYLPLLERSMDVNVLLEGDADGLFRQVRQKVNQFTKSTGASPFVSPA